MRFPDGSGTRHAPRIWNVAEDQATDALDAVATGTVSWGMLFWVPLMAGAGEEALIIRWKELVFAKVENRVRRGDLCEVALVFAELAGRRIVWNLALEGFDMLESQVAQSWVARGELRNQRSNLLELLAGRFPGAVPTDVVQLIEQQDNFGLLRDWFKAAVRASTFEEFMAVLKQ